MLIDMKINLNDFNLCNVEVTVPTEFNALLMWCIAGSSETNFWLGILGLGDSDGLSSSARNVKVFAKSVFSFFDFFVCLSNYLFPYLWSLYSFRLEFVI